VCSSDLSYRVYVGDVLQETVTAPSTTSVGTFSAGTMVRVSAVNAIGEGAKSSPATIAATVPGAPTITVFASSQVLFWEEPADGGAGELTGYKLFRNGVLVETGESWGNDSANVYDAGAVMTVLAINSFGEGPLSAPVTVT
jgi:hypothetical protein